MEWQDSTTYSRDQKDRTPTSWRLKTAALTISVVNSHRFYPGEWVMHCHEAGIDTHQINMPVSTFSAEDAQKRALWIVKKTLEAMLKSLPEQ